jgi:hypothetical protein
MKFAKTVFWIAGLWGLLVITPLYFMFDLVGRQDPPPITHPGFYYGFVGTALAWQFAFCILATDPLRYRPLMLAGIVEKATYSIAIVVLVLQHRTRPTDLLFAGTDFLLGVLFLFAYWRTSESRSSQAVVSK